MKSVLYRFNPWWEGEVSFNFVVRKKYLEKLRKLLPLKDIIILTGLRRTGKTTIMKMLIKNLLDSGVSGKNIFYASLDFYGFEKASILDLVEEFIKLHKISFSDKIYLFLDEIAHKESFAQQLKNIYDLYNAKVFASSSSASILKNQKSLLTGRERIIEVLPLDFEEFLVFKNVKIKPSNLHLIESYFEEYMKMGGMPEYVMTKDPEYIKQLVDDVIYKDISGHYGVKDKVLLRDFFKLLMERSGKQISLNKIAKVLGISVDTARRFLGFFEEAFLVSTIERCGKLNERLRAPRKVYVMDIGIRNLITGFRDKGAIFENLVYLKLKHRNPCYIYKNGAELDFFTEDEVLVEVKYNQEMSPKQQKLFNEIRASRKIVVKNVHDYLNF